MEEQTQTIQKVPFYKKKALMIPVITIFAMALMYAAAVNYFHQTQVDFTVNEARSSVDLPFTLSVNSGETATKDLSIHNAANVPLCAILTWQEDNNTGVTYTNNLPKTLTLAANSDTSATVSFTANEVTDAGSVTGNINYAKIACP